MKPKITISFLLLIAVASFAQTQHKDNAVDITSKQLLETGNIEELLKNFPTKEFTVVRYKLSIYEKGKAPSEFESNDNQLTSLMKERIKSTSKGAKVYFEYIKGKMKNSNDSIIRTFPPAAYIIN